MTLGWSASAGATTYTVRTFETASGNLVLNSSVTTLSTTASLSYATTYRWTVSACNASGCSADAADRYFQTPPEPVPATPANPSPGNTGPPGPTTEGKTVTLSWSAAGSATSYTVRVVNTATGDMVVHGSVEDTSTTASLEYATPYGWTVSACNASGCSSPTATHYFQTPPPPAPVETATDYILLNGNVIAQARVRDGVEEVTFLHTDLLGSPRKGTDEFGQVKWVEHYDPWGLRLNGVTEKIGYTGHAFDAETGYTYMQARFYDPLVGRFLSTDPIYFSDQDPFTFNRYSYANNNPYRYVDPAGMAACFYAWCQDTGAATFEGSRSDGSKLSGAGTVTATFVLLGAISTTVSMEVRTGSGGLESGSGSAGSANGGPSGGGPELGPAPPGVDGPDLPLESSAPELFFIGGVGKIGADVVGIAGKAAGLTTPGKFFGSKTARDLSDALRAKFGAPKSTRPGAETFYNPQTKRSYNVHTDPDHGFPHVDIRRRGGFDERQYPLAGGD